MPAAKCQSFGYAHHTILIFGMCATECRPTLGGLDYFAEFRVDDLLGTEPIPADQPPLVGLEATRVILRRDAAIDFTRTRQAQAVDEFDLDVRLGGGGPGGARDRRLKTLTPIRRLAFQRDGRQGDAWLISSYGGRCLRPCAR